MKLTHHHPSFPSPEKEQECILEQYRRCLFALRRERMKLATSPAPSSRS